jgi:hypothetical protein
VTGAKFSIGLDEVQALGWSDRPELVTVQVGSEAVVEGVYDVSDVPLLELAERVADLLDVVRVVARSPHGLVGNDLFAGAPSKTLRVIE